MKLLRLYLENFKSHSKTDLNLSEIRVGYILGQKNQDSTKSLGSGKSSIFDALEWCLTGVQNTKIIDDVVSHGQNKCVVIVEFEIEVGQFRIVRSRNIKSDKSDLRIFKKTSLGFIDDMTCKTTTETSVALRDLIKINNQIFRSSVYFSQGDTRGLPSVSSRERRNLLKEPLNLQIYSKYEKNVKDKLNILNKDIEKLRNSIQHIGEPENDIDKLTNDLNIKESSNTNRQNTYKELQIDIEKTLISISSINSNESQIKTLQSQLKIYVNKQIEVQNNIKNINIKQIETDIEKENAKLKENNVNLDKAQTILNNLTETTLRKIEDIQKDKENIQLKEIQGVKIIAEFDAKRIKYEHVLPEGEICGHCEQMISGEYRNEHEAQRLIELNKVIESLIKNKETLNKIKNKKATFDVEMQNIRQQEKLISEAKQKINEIETLKIKLSSSLENLNNILQHRRKSAAECDKALIEINDSKLVIENKLKELQSKENLEEKQRLENELKTLRAQQNELQNTISSVNVEIGAIKQKLSSIKEDIIKISELKTQLSIKEKEVTIKLCVQQAFGNSGIPNLIISTILNDLQSITNELLYEMYEGMQVIFTIEKIKEDGEIEDCLDMSYVIDQKPLKYDQLSGGQRLLISLCSRLALSKIIYRRLGIKLEFLILDEVDFALDLNSLDTFADIIKKWSGDFMILIITHNDYLKQKLSLFGNCIMVESDGEKSIGRIM